MDILTSAVKQIRKLQINGRKLQVNASLNVTKICRNVLFLLITVIRNSYLNFIFFSYNFYPCMQITLIAALREHQKDQCGNAIRLVV